MPHHGRSMWDEQTDDFSVAFNNSSREECSQWKLSNLSWLEIYSSRYWPVRGKIKLCETCWESLLSWSGIDHILYVINPHTSHCDIIIYKPLRHGRMSRYYRQEYFNKVKMEFHSQLVRGWIPSQACVLERWWYDGTRERESIDIKIFCHENKITAPALLRHRVRGKRARSIRRCGHHPQSWYNI